MQAVCQCQIGKSCANLAPARGCANLAPGVPGIYPGGQGYTHGVPVVRFERVPWGLGNVRYIRALDMAAYEHAARG